jgi:hypothetical protein
MTQRTLITVATDGFRDYVNLPDGRQVNLGSVSVLKLVSSLVRGSYECRQALNTFLKKKQVVIAVDLFALEDLLKPKRARWAANNDSFITTVSMITTDVGTKQQGKGASMNPDTTQVESIQTFYLKLASLEKTLSKIEGSGCATEADITSFHTTASDLFLEATGKTIQAAVDKDVLEDLELFMDNTGSLHNKFNSIIANVKRKMESGKYDPALSPKLWLYWVEDGVKEYAKEFSVNPKTMFPMELKKALAESFSKRYDAEVKAGEYGDLKVKKASDDQEPEQEVAKEEETKKEETKNATEVYYKLAASDVPAINEAFADSVMSKVETTLKTIEASSKKGTEVAQKDLNTITLRLATLIERSSLDDPSLSIALRKLSGMVDQIQSHFA